MNKPHILLIQNNLSYGGTTSLILFIVKYLSDKYVFDLFCFEDNAIEKEKEFLSYGGEIIRSNKINYNKRGLRGRLTSYWQRSSGKITRVFYKTILGKDYYAVHCFEDMSSGYYLKACKRLGIKNRIIHFNIDHSETKATNPINWFLLRKEIRLIKKYSTVFAAGSIQSMPKDIAKDKETIVINNPIDSKFVFNDYMPKELNILQVGTYNDNKNQLFSLEVFRTLVDKYKLNDAKLRFVGQQPTSEKSYLETLNNKISEYGLNKNVEVLGPSDHPEKLFAQNSVLIFPSRKEAFGLVLVEAQACGMQCFSSLAAAKDTDLGGVCFLNLEDGPEKWAKIICDYYKGLSYSKKNFDTSKYSPENIRKVYISLYEKNQ